MKNDERQQKRIIILGNGFDLDLGLSTQYQNFLNSKYFQDLGKETNLFYWLLSKHEFQTWTDIEEELKLFAIDQSHRKSHFTIDLQKHFNSLTNALCKYLNSFDYKNLKRDSMAYALIECIANTDCYNIYNYNYTDLKKIYKELGFRELNNYIHVHGKAIDNSIILGFEDDVDIDTDYNFMIKTFSPHYHSCHIQRNLKEAKVVIFFGHSLSCTDYRYFADFFNKQSSLNIENGNSKRIIIITYNENSRRQLLQQLWDMNNRRTGLLFDQNEFSIFCTSKKQDRDKLLELFTYLRNAYEYEQERYQESSD